MTTRQREIRDHLSEGDLDAAASGSDGHRVDTEAETYHDAVANRADNDITEQKTNRTT